MVEEGEGCQELKAADAFSERQDARRALLKKINGLEDEIRTKHAAGASRR
jgi:hypothetical protein